MPMHDDDYARIQPVIAMAQRLHGSLHDKLMQKGVLAIDALIASTYATHALATKVHGNPVTAISWMRDVLDLLERQMLEEKE